MSFGEELRRERELRQISLREVAQATKINVRYLEAMERNDFAYLPGELYNRGFVRAYCEHIGVDSESMVNAYLLEEQTQAGASTGADERLLRGPVRGALQLPRESEMWSRGAEEQRRRRRRIWTIVLAVALITAGAFVAFWALGGLPRGGGS